VSCSVLSCRSACDGVADDVSTVPEALQVRWLTGTSPFAFHVQFCSWSSKAFLLSPRYSPAKSRGGQDSTEPWISRCSPSVRSRPQARYELCVKLCPALTLPEFRVGGNGMHALQSCPWFKHRSKIILWMLHYLILVQKYVPKINTLPLLKFKWYLVLWLTGRAQLAHHIVLPCWT
jgi:hypothetical protein